MTVAASNFPPFTGTAPDSDTVVICPGASRLLIQVANQPVLITFGHGPAGAVMWEPYAEPYQPTIGSLSREFDAFKVRAQIPKAQLPPGALQAYVNLTAR